MRFRPEQHLRRPGDIRAVRENGRRIDCRAFTLWWKPRAQAVGGAAAAPRVCVVASRAAVGAATRRNRAKRRLREIFRQHQDSVPAGCDVLLVARSAVNEWPMADLEGRFVEACRQIRPPVPVPDR
jgi:ribonuclease P protein component